MTLRIVLDVSLRQLRINHEIQFFAAGAIFGKVLASLFMAGAAFRENLRDSRSAKCDIFPCKMRLQDGTSKVLEAAGAR